MLSLILFLLVAVKLLAVRDCFFVNKCVWSLLFSIKKSSIPGIVSFFQHSPQTSALQSELIQCSFYSTVFYYTKKSTGSSSIANQLLSLPYIIIMLYNVWSFLQPHMSVVIIIILLTIKLWSADDKLYSLLSFVEVLSVCVWIN